MRLFAEFWDALRSEGLSGGSVQYTVLDGGGGYFQNVRRILEFSPQRIVLAGKRGKVCVEGEGLLLGKCVNGDVEIKGNVVRVGRE